MASGEGPAGQVSSWPLASGKVHTGGLVGGRWRHSGRRRSCRRRVPAPRMVLWGCQHEGGHTVCPQCPALGCWKARCCRYLLLWLSLRDPKSPVRGCPAKGRRRTPVRSQAPFPAGQKPSVAVPAATRLLDPELMPIGTLGGWAGPPRISVSLDSCLSPPNPALIVGSCLTC